MCFGCQLATPANLDFVYCKDCVDKLDPKDPTMNIPLLELLSGVNKVELISEYGYDKYAALVDISKQFRLIGEKLFKAYGDNLREIPCVSRRRGILAEMHNAGGHVGVMKLYHMVRSMFYWPSMIEDCVSLVEQCVHCKNLKEKPKALPLKPTHKFDKPF